MRECLLVLLGCMMLSSLVALPGQADVQSEQVPAWIKDIFVLYAAGDISDFELLNAIEYLVQIGIIAVDDQVNAPMQDSGDFVAHYSDTDNDIFSGIKEDYQDRQFLETDANYLSALFVLPYDVGIWIEECGEPNAFYYPDNKRISLCYEYVELVLKPSSTS